MKCGSCRSFRPLRGEGDLGVCVVYPPREIVPWTQARYPRVDPDAEPCGEYKGGGCETVVAEQEKR
jgi:hypothetical protein